MTNSYSVKNPRHNKLRKNCFFHSGVVYCEERKGAEKCRVRKIILLYLIPALAD